MIVVRVELHSARTRKITELARMHISNDGTSDKAYRNYYCQTFRGRSKEKLNNAIVIKDGRLFNWPSERLHVWNLVRQALTILGYTSS